MTVEDEESNSGEKDMAGKLRRALTTGMIAIAIAVPSWFMIVVLIHSYVHAGSHLLWAGTLWLSATSSTLLTSYFRFRDRPVLGCTVAFGAFSLVYFACEGPIFGNVNQGGDPDTTELVFWNLTLLPLGVFAASELGSRLGGKLRGGSGTGAVVG